MNDAWKKIAFTKFSGYETFLDQSQVKDEALAAIDICNFRMEKVGKLVTRDGYLFGLYLNQEEKTYYEENNELILHKNVVRYIENAGIIGMSEFVLSDYWDAIDTDTLMVYAINGKEIIEDNGQQIEKYVMTFLFSPITGKFKNKLLIPNSNYYNDFINYVSYSYIENPMGDPTDPNETFVELKGRRRELDLNDDEWIAQFIDMKQYQNKLVISDRINGDLILEDEYDMVENPQCPEQKHRTHRLVLHKSGLVEFDIDKVKIDLEIGQGGKNVDVVTGMALYKFVAQKSNYLASEGYDEMPVYEANDYTKARELSEKFKNDIKKYIVRLSTALYPHKYNFDKGPTKYVKIENSINKDFKILLTNADYSGEEYDDLLKPVELDKEKYYENDSLIEERIADVYRWEDYKIKYNICSGLKLDSKYMNEANRIFDKLTRGLKVKKTTVKDKYGREIPLGIYKYRFVWDFGNGIYSAPSAELVVPELLWSAVSDDELKYNGQYKRPIITSDIKYYENRGGDNYIEEGNYFTSCNVPRCSFTINLGNIQTYCNLWEYDDNNEIITLSSYGEKFFRLKEKLYNKVQNRFGVRGVIDDYKNISFLNDYSNYSVFTRINDLGCILTTAFGKYEKTKGYIGFFGYFKGDDRSEWDNFHIAPDEFGLSKWRGRWSAPSGTFVKIIPLYLTFEMQRNTDDKRGILPIFDEEGRFLYGHKSAIHKRYLVIPYLIEHITKEVLYRWDGDIVGKLYGGIALDPPADGVRLYFKGVHNLSDWFTSPYSNMRNALSDVDMLYNTNIDLPLEVKSRMILEGAVGINIIDYDEPFTIIQCKYYRYRHNTQNLYWQILSTNDPNSWNYNTPFAFIRKLIVYGSKDVNNIPSSMEDTCVDIVHENTPNTPMNINGGLKVVLYASGARLLAHEQLTAFFPSSLLFGAPRIAIKIDKKDVPIRAKKLLIFRTPSSHSNDYRNDKFGLVKAIDIKRDNDVYFFDDVKDSELDYGTDINYYLGKTNKIYSRFCYLLNERLWKYNFKEEYQPIAPRGKADDVTINYMLLDKDDTIDGGRCFTQDQTLYYAIAYEDTIGVISKRKTFEVDVQADKVVALYLLPENYDSSIKQLNIYRRKIDDPDDENYYLIGSITDKNQHIFIDNNIPITNQTILCDEMVVYTYEGGLRWSQPYRPDWFKEDDFVDYNSGDGTEGTGITSLSGDLILFKENSMRRLTVQGADIPITRTDDITNDVGCIAPLSLLNVNNIVFFLSKKGFMVFDNNIPRNVDDPFLEELLFRLSNCGVLARYVTSGYNYFRNEIYLNVPLLVDNVNVVNKYKWYSDKSYYKKIDDDPVIGKKWKFFKRRIWGHIYVINLEKGYYTKFAYQPSVMLKYKGKRSGKKIFTPIGNIRMYYTDRSNTFRSADIFPNLYYMDLNDTE